MMRYRNLQTVAPDYQPMEFWTSEEEQSPAEWLASLGPSGDGNGDVVQLPTEENAG
jgi:hypothetical protein